MITRRDLHKAAEQNGWTLYQRTLRNNNVNNYIVRCKGYSAYFNLMTEHWRIMVCSVRHKEGYGLTKLQEFFSNTPARVYRDRSVQDQRGSMLVKPLQTSQLTLEQRVSAEQDDNNYDYMS